MWTNYIRSSKEGVKKDARSQETPQLIPAPDRGRIPNILLNMQILYQMSHLTLKKITHILLIVNFVEQFVYAHIMVLLFVLLNLLKYNLIDMNPPI